MTQQIINLVRNTNDYENTTTFDAIDIKPPNTNFLLIWEIGKRCNYDCTYCGPTRHDLRAPHIDWQTLSKTSNFVFEYLELIMKNKNPAERGASCVFTGGEPTVNPKFIDLCKLIRETHEGNFKDLYKLTLSWTSNGTFSKKMADNLIQYTNRGVISYHTEADPRMKKKVVENIKYLHEKNFTISVNVMMHAAPEYFQECIDLMEEFKGLGINYTPRIIGDKETKKTKGDYGTHVYTKHQEDWLKNFWAEKNAKVNQEEVIKNKDTCSTQAGDESARKLGRMCCGGKTMCTYKDGIEQPVKFIESTRFKDWHCGVNWYFMAIDQQLDLVYHHQTCQAKFDGTRGPIGTITDSEKIITELRTNLTNKTMPVIVCPNKICNCGVCTPKSSDKNQFFDIMSTHVVRSIFSNLDKSILS